MVFLHTNRHRKDLPQYGKKILLKLPYPTNSSIELSKFANIALHRIYSTGYLYKKTGVVVMNITPTNEKQITLFENSDERHVPIMKAIDKINKSIGMKKIKLASQDIQKTWKMRQDKLSPRYTTRLDEIITVNV